MVYLLIIVLFFAGVFFYIMKKDKRTLMSGVFFVLTLLLLGIWVMFLIFKYSQVLSNYPLIMSIIGILAAILVILLILLPILLIIFLFYNGIKIMLKEGFKSRNVLSLAFSIFLFLYLIIWPRFNQISSNDIASDIYFYVGMLALYFLFLMMMYTLSNMLNLMNFKKKDLDFVVVLGAGLIKDKVTPLLAGRIDKGIEVYEKNENSKIIFSGGKGSDELVAEGVAMARYAIEKGVPKDEILIEDKSKNTKENILFSYNMMKSQPNVKEVPKFAIATNSYHVFRALVIAKSMGIDCIGYGSRSKWYFTLNAFIREFIGYIHYTRKRHINRIIVITILYFIVILLTQVLSKFAI
ncbi:MAG: YdcF family protein [Peptostreptococcus sp.]|uniref:YdcF family protein n=1 Tax=Peptostreptococcus sp. TaxID=1262 RepID=UPI002FC6D6C5